MPVRRQPVVGEPAGHPRKEEGGEVREHPRLGQDQETRVVRHHLQPPELLLRPPAAPPVARSALEGAVLPRRQAQPPVPEACHVAQAAGRQPLEAEIVALVHQRVPERALLRPGQPDLDVRQGKPRRHPAKRGMELEALANRHGRSIARPGRERQRKIPAPRSRAHATQTSPVSRKTSRNQRGMPLLHSSITLDMSGEFSDCVFVRVAMGFDASMVSVAGLKDAVVAHSNSLLALVGLEADW